MGKRRRLPPKRLIQGNMLWRGNEPLLAADDVRHLHQVVVHDIGEMVRREPIRLENDKVLLDVLLLEVAVDGVAEFRVPKGVSLEADDVRLAGGRALGGFRRVDGAAGAGVDGGLAGFVEFALLGLELLRAAEAAVCVALVYEFLNVVFVYWESLRLEERGLADVDLSVACNSPYLSIWSMGSATVRTFIPF